MRFSLIVLSILAAMAKSARGGLTNIGEGICGDKDGSPYDTFTWSYGNDPSELPDATSWDVLQWCTTGNAAAYKSGLVGFSFRKDYWSCHYDAGRAGNLTQSDFDPPATLRTGLSGRGPVTKTDGSSEFTCYSTNVSMSVSNHCALFHSLSHRPLI